MHLCARAFTHGRACAYARVCMNTCVGVCVLPVHVRVHVCLYPCMLVCIDAFVHACVCACMRLCVHTNATILTTPTHTHLTVEAWADLGRSLITKTVFQQTLQSLCAFNNFVQIDAFVGSDQHTKVSNIKLFRWRCRQN